jgi:acyl carrier protein
MKAKETTVLNIVQVIVDKLGVDQNLLSYKASFTDDLGVDSLDVYELLMTIEKEFKLKIDEEDAEKLTTVGALIDYIEEKATYPIPGHKAEVFIMNKKKEDILNKSFFQVPEY